MDNLNKIAGFGNPNRDQQFFQHNATGLVTKNFYGFIPVGGNMTFTSLTNMAGTDVKTTYNTSGTYYQDKYYPGNFKSFNAATLTEVIIYLTEQ